MARGGNNDRRTFHARPEARSALTEEERAAGAALLAVADALQRLCMCPEHAGVSAELRELLEGHDSALRKMFGADLGARFVDDLNRRYELDLDSDTPTSHGRN